MPSPFFVSGEATSENNFGDNVAGLREQIRQARPFQSVEEETYLNLQRTANLLFQSGARIIKGAAPGRRGLTPSQYNVLRILRGAAPNPLTCGEISRRLVTPGPDVTRLLDRLESQGWVERAHDEVDRRLVRSRITEAGLNLLGDLDGPVAEWLQQNLGHLDADEQHHLIRLLEKVRAPAEEGC